MTYSLKSKLFFVRCKLRFIVRKVWKKICRRLHLKVSNTKRYGHVLANLEQTQEVITQLIQSGKPFMVGRLGGVESLVASDCICLEMGLKKKLDPILVQKAQINAGFFPPEEKYLRHFSKLLCESVRTVDVIGSMTANDEEFILKQNLSKKAIITDLGNLEPYYFDKPWSKALENKRVLVISPFVDSIKKQYAKRTLLFANPDILPQFELLTIKAVQSIAGTKTEFDDWFDALQHMYDEAMNKSFDIAIIGCGAYGFPLASMLKQAGKQAIHLGGATQILFGIWGSRWENVAPVKKLKNEYWIRPSDDETPIMANKVENACYW